MAADSTSRQILRAAEDYTLLVVSTENSDVRAPVCSVGSLSSFSGSVDAAAFEAVLHGIAHQQSALDLISCHYVSESQERQLSRPRQVMRDQLPQSKVRTVQKSASAAQAITPCMSLMDMPQETCNNCC